MKKIREALEREGLGVWADSRQLVAGDPLEREVWRAIDESTHVLAVLTVAAMNSDWVYREIEYAKQAKKTIIPLLGPGMQTAALRAWFGEKQPVALKLADGPGAVTAALQGLLVALGEMLPHDAEPAPPAEAAPMADLILKLTDPKTVVLEGGRQRAGAKATLIYQPAAGARAVGSARYDFISPLGQIDRDELAWYLERYINWPTGIFQDRAVAMEKQLPQWGEALYGAVDQPAARTALEAWKAVTGVERRFTVRVEKETGGDEAATQLLALPWELIRDGRGYLFQGAHGVRVRRSLPNRDPQPAVTTKPPIRVLLLSPRPEQQGVGYIDHRVSARPVVEALNRLGELAEFMLLDPPTFGAMEAELRRALKAKEPYHVVHFDGHGVYDQAHGLGALCFEDPADAAKTEGRRMQLVTSDKIAEVIRGHRVPLFFLEACQTAQADLDPAASVAGALLESGVASVAAMSHSVLVETARLFVSAFYPALLSGERVGEAMLAGQRALKMDTRRGQTFVGELRLEDWFVPVLFQEQDDARLICDMPGARGPQSVALALGALPDAPAHSFVGRSRELLTAERILARAPYVVLLGEGGEGKTTLAVELARWLVTTRRFRRAAFVALDQDGDARKMLSTLGDQLMKDFGSQSALHDPWQLVERALRDQATVLVVDNVESVVDDPAIFELCTKLNRLAKLVFTSREALPAPFELNTTRVGRLDRYDAIRLVGLVLGEGNLMPHAFTATESEEEIAALVDSVGCHARALVLLAREVAATGVRAATADIAKLMQRMEARHPGERERSLLASVQLSLRRLPAGMRERIQPLGVFQGGGSLDAIGPALGLEPDEARAVGRALVEVGLAEAAGFSYLRFDPALAPALWLELSEEAQAEAKSAWAEAMAELVGFLYQHQFKDANLALNLARLELPNLVAAVAWLGEQAEPERVVDLAARLEALIADLGRPTALEQVGKIRAAGAGRLGAWSHAGFVAELTAMERLIEAGQHSRAVAAGRSLLHKALAAGESAYLGAAYDLAMVQFTLGRALQRGGGASEALAVLEEARRRFQGLGASGMANVALTVTADCLVDLGRLDEAASAYEEAIAAAQERDDPRSVAVGQGQLATVRRRQERYPEALALYAAVKDIFTRLGEPGSVAVVWHQIAIVHQYAEQLEAAEHAYQESLKLTVQAGNRSEEAATLNALGSLYSKMDRAEDAVRFYRQASDRYAELGDRAHEGSARSNAADELIRLRRSVEARIEVNRAIECKKEFGHASQPWTTFHILHNLERAEGREIPALAARRQAVEFYLAYRRDGGESTTPAGQLFDRVARQPDAAREWFAGAKQQADLPGYIVALIPALEAVLDGSRDPALADNPEIDYDDAAELLLLLETLSARAGTAG